ncbi:helix-turn-helix transcriptional regulator [Candidatus Saccharibacteria bacterium]|nr:helix-turn-helix transcriptional regulator [Candidatus Saccharibacteria bacterium]MBQ6461574.1 helix-turn-helix transcriptional regulator [Candidatus Saccharibacteria bacterium]
MVKEKSYTHNDEYYYQIVRENVRKHRTTQNLTQQDLADMTDMSREYICDIENESRNKHLTISVLGRIAEALKVPIGEFFSEQ